MEDEKDKRPFYLLYKNVKTKADWEELKKCGLIKSIPKDPYNHNGDYQDVSEYKGN